MVRLAAHRFGLRAAWSLREVKAALAGLLEELRDRLPADRGAHLLLKPNLNNDLIALTGNATDLRVLAGLIELLQDLGYHHLTVADGPNVGVERRGIDVFARLRVTGLAQRYGVALCDLNRCQGRRVALEAGASPLIALPVLEADCRISVPTIKTHAAVGMSLSCKNWVGVAVAQDKRQMHLDLGRTIASLIAAVPPELVVVDGLVGMEGNGPGDGDPVRLGFVAVGDSPWATDLALCRALGFDWQRVPYLLHGQRSGRFERGLPEIVAQRVPLRTRLRPAPPRSLLAEVSERRGLLWLKRALRPLTGRPAVAELAYRAKIIQDVYRTQDDSLRLVSRDASRCGECSACESVCPTGLSLDRIGQDLTPPDCIQCLYCWWVCPHDALALSGEPGAMARQIARYRGRGGLSG